ncbi:M48 family metallopeptidase [soil metagenome]|jgi:hypothetical protein
MPSKYLNHVPVFLFVLLMLCFRLNLYAQINHLQTDTVRTSDHVYQNADAYKAFLEKTANENTSLLNSKLQKQYRKIIAEKNAGLIKQLNEKGFLFDAAAYPYLNSIFDHILDANSLDKNRFHFFIDRTLAANAYSYEDGTVVCDLGLVSIMENESQIAFVFCHELGHYLLKHVNTEIVKQLEKYNSPEFLARVKSIKKQSYNTKNKLEDLLADEVFDRRKHNRFQERAADSLGMLLFMHTNYSCKMIPRVFDLLDAAESKTAICKIGTFFKQEGISIDEDGLKPANIMSFGKPVKKDVVDALKTHPDCAQRKITMQSFFDQHPKPGVEFFIGTPQKLSAIKKTALFDEAAYLKENDNLSFYFYQLIQNNAQFPSNKYIKTEIFNTLLSVCSHYQAHTLYMVVSNQYAPDDDKDEYAKLLKLFDSLSLKEMKEIAITYYQNNKSLINASKEAINNLNKLNN